MKKWEKCQQEYAFDHGWKFDENEMLILTQKQFKDYQYSGKLIKDPKTKTLMIPSAHGCCLILEGMHFRVEN